LKFSICFSFLSVSVCGACGLTTDANVQYMGRIDKESDDAILSGDTDLEGAVTTDGQAAGSAN
jgi:hypothetical protein